MRNSQRTVDTRTSVTVAICVYTSERWPTLRCAIDMCRNQMHSEDELLVVVDYNDSLLTRCIEALDDCRVIPNNRRRGLSGARNTAICAARKAVLVFLDDDAVPLDGWLDAIRAPYADNRVCGVGGRAEPRWHGSRPNWFPEEFLWVIGCSYLGLPTEAHPVRNLIGANMSFRRTVFEQVGHFVETMGRIRSRPLGCEETEFSIRLTQINHNAVLMYDPSAKVEHYVSQRRCSMRYFVNRCWAEGLSKAQVTRRVGRSSALRSERDYTMRVLPRGIWRGITDSLNGDIWGVTRAATIVLGLTVTSVGYCIGTRLRSLDPDMATG
jgi:glycosyltransferase involved in cell wall biosynthesis